MNRRMDRTSRIADYSAGCGKLLGFLATCSLVATGMAGSVETVQVKRYEAGVRRCLDSVESDAGDLEACTSLAPRRRG